MPKKALKIIGNKTLTMKVRPKCKFKIYFQYLLVNSTMLKSNFHSRNGFKKGTMKVQNHKIDSESPIKALNNLY